jgi:hypothetical protein
LAGTRVPPWVRTSGPRAGIHPRRRESSERAQHRLRQDAATKGGSVFPAQEFRMITTRRIPLLAGLVAGFLLVQAPAGATDLYVGALNTAFARGDTSSGNFQVLGACGGQIQSMAQDGDDLFLGDVGGNVYRYQIGAASLGYAFTAGNDAKALALVGRDLYIGGTNGVVERRDAITEALVSSWNVGVPVTALIVRGQYIYAGSSFGIVQRGSRTAGNFAFWGTCGGPINSIAGDATHVILGTQSGWIYRVALATGQLTGQFQVPSDATAMAVEGTTLLVAGTDAVVRRVNRMTGAPISSVTWDFPVQAMALSATEVGSRYCFGVSCPCGNDDPTAGCRNSTGVGALLQATGSASATADDLVLEITQMPLNSLGRLYMGAGTNHVPFGDGFQCAGAGGYGLFRFPVQSASGVGAFAFGPGISSFAAGHFGPTGQIFAGQTWNFEGWYRNPLGPCGSGFNTTNAVSVVFSP